MQRLCDRLELDSCSVAGIRPRSVLSAVLPVLRSEVSTAEIDSRLAYAAASLGVRECAFVGMRMVNIKVSIACLCDGYSWVPAALLHHTVASVISLP